MENTVNMFQKKSETTRSPTRLQRRAPTALHLDHVPENPFLQQSCETVATTAIPLLSPLFVSPNLHTREEDDFRFPVGFTDKNGSQPSMDHKEGWQYSAKADNSNQMALLSMFQTKFVLVDQSQ
ncbi:unnamed protein product [Microthlaspi erraticum]|uniref:Uncharacterized protein n=1 Tax=Microthlaspi erraticum TaxID=1685480 RepID=A0A6D2II30_9BRAS|nr:unnamed protein product [Microthlaspi erraticum]